MKFTMAVTCCLLASQTALGSDFFLMVVDKKNLKASLFDLPEIGQDQKLIEKFSIATGKEEGDKFKQGDNKTPEGIYFPGEIIDTSKMDPEKYGEQAVPLDFPNPLDSKQGKTGYGIWLHGAGNEGRMAARQITEGCVAFFNQDILKVAQKLKPSNSIVMIVSGETSEINKKEDQLQIHQKTQQWLSAWKTRNINDYMNFYKKDFVSNGKNWSGYKKYKQRIFQLYKKMDIATQNVRTIVHQKYALSVMSQKFSGDSHFVSKGRKILYWEKENGEWKISAEDFSGIPFGSTIQIEKNLTLKK